MIPGTMFFSGLPGPWQTVLVCFRRRAQGLTFSETIYRYKIHILRSAIVVRTFIAPIGRSMHAPPGSSNEELPVVATRNPLCALYCYLAFVLYLKWATELFMGLIKLTLFVKVEFRVRYRDPQGRSLARMR